MTRAFSLHGQADAYAWERKQVASWLREAGSSGLSLRDAATRAAGTMAHWSASAERHLSELIRAGSAVLRDGRYYAAPSGASGASVVRDETHRSNEEG